MEYNVKNHSKEAKNASKNDYDFTQEKRKNSVFHCCLIRQGRHGGLLWQKGVGIYEEKILYLSRGAFDGFGGEPVSGCDIFKS